MKKALIILVKLKMKKIIKEMKFISKKTKVKI